MRRLGGLAGFLVAAFALVAIAPAAAEARTQTFDMQTRPFTLSGFQTIFPKIAVPTPERAGYVTQMDAWLVDARGRKVTIRDVMLHHIVFINAGRPGGAPKRSSCAGRSSEPFWGTGEEMQPLMLPPGYGYPVGARERWNMQAMLMSHSLRAHTVRIRYRVRMVLGERRKRVKPLWLRANGCTKHPSYDIEGDMPPGGVHKRQHLWRMPISGRIVAASAHLHGSSYGMTVQQPRCADRTLIDHKPLYGLQSDIVYRAKPILHEPGPIATGHFQSQTGIPVRKGEFLRVTGLYDGTRPHVQAMAISHVYIAAEREAPRACAPPPTDARILWTRKSGRTQAPVVEVPLNGIGADGQVREIDRPAGPEQFSMSPTAAVSLARERILPANISVARGTRVNWDFVDAATHNITLASGPRLIGSANVRKGARYSRTLNTPGTYKLFCYLHPITMTQVIAVRP